MLVASLKNLLWYRKDRFVDLTDLNTKIEEVRELGAMKSLLTELMLRAVGLKVAESGNSLSRFIYLTKVQRSRKRLAETGGYSVGLL